MAEHKDSAEAPVTKEAMMQRLSADTSRAFLDEMKPEKAQTKVQAQAEWWQSLNKDSPAPAYLHASDLPELQKNGWKLKEDPYYNQLSRQLKDGTVEVDTYENQSGQRLNTQFSRYSDGQSPGSSMPTQFVSVSYRDGQMPLGLNVRTGNFGDEFRASFNERGKLSSAYEWGSDKDSVNYSFRDDGSLYEMLKRSRKTSEVLNDQLFNKSGEPRSDYNPLYLYEAAKRPIVNIYMGLREMRRSSGIF